MLFFTHGNFKCPTKLSVTTQIWKHSHIYLATITGPQILFQYEDQGLLLEKSFPPYVLYCLLWLGNWAFISSKLGRDSNTPSVGTKATKGQIMKLPFILQASHFTFLSPFSTLCFIWEENLFLKAPNPLSVRELGRIDK